MLNKLIVLAATPSQFGGVKLDASVNILAVIAIISFVSQIAVAYINNKNQAKEREKEREYERENKQNEREYEIRKREQQIQAEEQKQKIENEFKLQVHKNETYFKNQTIAFEEVLEAVGNLLGDSLNKEKYSTAMSCINKAFAYSDKKLTYRLEDLKLQVGQFGGITEGDCTIISAFDSLKEVADQMNIILKRNANIE